MTAYVILFAMSIACGAVLWRCRARYRTPGGAAAQCRTHPATRALVCILCVELAMAGIMTRGAYADAYQVAWSTDSDGTQWCFVVSPDNEFDATLYALGLGMYPLSQDQRAYLSSAQYGGMFYTISQRWAPIQHYLSEYEGSSLYTQFLAFVMDTPLMQVTYNIMGMDAYTIVWTATISDAEKEQAKQDFNDVVNGNISGGGGGDTGLSNTFSMYCNYSFSTYGATNDDKVFGYVAFNDGNGTVYTTRMNANGIGQGSRPLIETPYNITVNGLQLPEIPQGYSTDNVLITYAPSSNVIGIGIQSTPVTLTTLTTNSSVTSKSYQMPIGIYANVSYITVDITNVSYSASGMTCDGTARTNTWNSLSGNTTIKNTDTNVFYGVVGGGSGGTPTPPENDWPGDDDDQPTAPQLPVINIPGITLPTLPTITLDPTININVNDPTNTSPTDYTPWLKAIKDTLTDGFDNLYSELSEHCYHLQEQMQHQALYIADSITDYMEECITTLVTDMQAIARYIVESLTYYFGNGSYNDNNVIYWLRRIWMRLGGGSPSPVNEPEDAWDWFKKLIVGLLSDIIAVGSDLAADVVELISQVMTKFPISIPWDIAAILGLFAATPVTPHFEVPVNVPNVVNTTLVIDLGFLDGAMTTVRAFELIAFAVYLLWMTKDIVKIFDETGFV